MNLADHLRPLLRDHDCVIIPDFGALVAETTPARVQPGTRHQLSPPSRPVAFNQALTRNDGLLVDALAQYLGLTAAAAREALRQAVATLTHELAARQRTELPGIGVFRQLAGRGLQFEYTGTENLLPAAFGLPELTAHPVRATDARVAREQQAQLAPRLRSASRGWQLRRVVPGAAIGLLAGLAVAGLYLLNLHPETLPAAWQSHLPRWEQANQPVAAQQAALAQPSFTAPTPVAAAPEPEPVALAPEPTAASTWDTDPEPTPPEAVQVAPAQAAPKQAAPAKIVKAAPAHATPAAVISAPADPTPVATVHPAPRAADPVDALLAQPNALPSPIVARPRGKRKLPAAAAIAVANESNIARPVPMAQRTAATPALATSYAALHAAPAVPKPAPTPEAATTTPVTAKVVAAPVAHPVVTKPAAHPAAKPAAPLAKAAAATPAKVPVAKAVAPAAATAATINTRTGRYYVVVGAYNSLAHAQQGLRNLLLTGHAGAKIIVPYPGTRFFRLSAADYADRPMAQFAASQLRKTPHADQGLTVFPY
ncbi:SPOR domain-containing protein [Hymenobacter psoromatis]|uniref:HU domain-containing protein n=1 Tax=Hymenobacter psoromatis TaxID=1484116 RepID=UPI001CBFCEE4|nr:SPOR domain-containing protein [Hymenobacter psoromatis]